MTRGLEISAPVSVGELIDKITILEIKSERIEDAAKRSHVNAELDALRRLRAAYVPSGIDEATVRLKAVNEALWEIEDEIRLCDRRGDFGPRFIELARSVYQMNDERARLKQEINRLSGSRFVEQKSYV